MFTKDQMTAEGSSSQSPGWIYMISFKIEKHLKWENECDADFFTVYIKVSK